uniref:Uncharacterized protein n=1 Tax=viral metagenome TaxID=1070528 RepID=A0A6C0KDM2_9ZZZZ
MSGEQKSGESKVQIPQFRQASAKALAEGKTTGHISSGVRPPSPGSRLSRRSRFGLRTSPRRGVPRTVPDHPWGEGLHHIGILDEVEEHGKKRKEKAAKIKAIGKRNRDIFPIKARMGVKEGKETETIPAFLTERIKQLSKDPISDLTKTSLGAESQRKVTGIKKDKRRKKDPQSAGKRKTRRKKRRKTKKNKRSKKRRVKKRKTRKRRRKRR